MASGKDKGKGVLQGEDKALWDHVTRTVTPLVRPAPAPEDMPIRTQPELEEPEAEPAPKGWRPVDLLEDMIAGLRRASSPPPAPAAGLDRRTEEKFRKGKMAIDARLDLHGMTLARAADAFSAFIIASHKRGHRCVLVITGKGGRGRSDDADPYAPAPGILRRTLPEWIAQNPLSAIILRAVPAQPKDGGEGAFYILLRRVR